MFSIVTANWNGERVLENYLKSLSNQSYKEFKLYIVDNGSNDSSESIINRYMEKMDIELITLEENKGFSVANNIGIIKALNDESSYIMTLNNDLELEKNCLMNCYKAINLKGNEFEIFQLLLINYFDRNLIDAAGIKIDSMYGVHQVGYKTELSRLDDKLLTDIDGACAGAAIYSKSSLKTIRNSKGDFFDSVYFAYYEDADLAMRLRRADFKTLLIDDAIVYHLHSATSGQNSYFKTFLLSRNSLIFLFKNASETEFRKLSIKFYFKIFVNVLKNIIRMNFSAAKGCIEGVLKFKYMKNKGFL